MSATQYIKLRAYEVYAQGLWRFHRVLVSKHLTPRCNVCAISSAYTQLSNGLCDECYSLDQTTIQDEYSENKQELSILNEYLGKTENNSQLSYHALVLSSGGKDSAYLIHKLKKDYPDLKILAAFIDSGFASPLAISNHSRITSSLDVDSIVIKPHVELYKNAFRVALRKAASLGCYRTVDRVDGDLFHDIARSFAQSLDIPFVITGVSPEQVSNIFNSSSCVIPDVYSIKNFIEVAGFDPQEIFFSKADREKYSFSSISKKAIPTTLFPYLAWGYDEESVKQEVQRLGLLDSKKSSPIVTNHRLVPLMAYVDIHNFGYSTFEPEFCRLIRYKKASYSFWRSIFEMAEYCAKTGWLLQSEIDELLSELGISDDELKREEKK